MKITLNFLLACFVASLFSHTLSATTFRTVALSGDVAPVGGGVLPPFPRFDNQIFHGISVNADGQVAFYANLTGVGIDVSNQVGIWSEGSGSLGLVARRGNQAPGTPFGVKLAALSHPVLNDVGQSAFRGSLTGPSTDATNLIGIWSEGSGSLNLVARAGDHAPGTLGGISFLGERDLGGGFADFGMYEPVFNAAGKTAFSAYLTGPGIDETNDLGIWSEGSGSLALVAREGNQAPGTPFGVKFGGLSDTPVLNSAGSTAFRGRVVGPGVDSTNENGIWAENRPGAIGLGLVVRDGEAAPGTPLGVNFSSFFPPVINDAGEIAFTGNLTGPGVDSTNDQGVWSEGSGPMSLVARAGNPAPGTPFGIDFAFFRHVVINAEGKTAFRGLLTGPGIDTSNREGIWSDASGSLTLIARESVAAPGTAPGVNFGELNNARPILNALGKVAFYGNLTGPGIDPSSNDGGIWAQDASGILQLIVREGDLFDVSNDPGDPDMRTIDLLFFDGRTGLEDGRSGGFNDLGQVAFFAKFTDGSTGAFVTEVVVLIPEPSSVWLVVTACVGLLRRRSRS